MLGVATENQDDRRKRCGGNQNIAQIEDNKSILKIVAGNAHAVICLKASPDDEAFILPFMEPEVKKGEA